MEMRRSVPLGERWRFPVGKKVVKSAFGGFNELSCYFGSLGWTFRLDTRCFEHPVINGSVIASLSVSRARTGILQIYPIPIAVFGNVASESFEKVVVPHLVNWLQAQMIKPETAVLGHEQIIVSWYGNKFDYAQVRFL